MKPEPPVPEPPAPELLLALPVLLDELPVELLEGEPPVPELLEELPVELLVELAVELLEPELLELMATVQVPPMHVPSGHGVPSGAIGFEHMPEVVSQVPTPWHASMAVQVTGLPPLHTPAIQVSVCVHGLLSLQVVPLGAVGFEHMPVVVSQVPTTWHASMAVQVTGLPPVHTPVMQVSVCVQALPSEQVVPSGRFGFEHVPEAGSQRPTAWH